MYYLSLASYSIRHISGIISGCIKRFLLLYSVYTTILYSILVWITRNRLYPLDIGIMYLYVVPCNGVLNLTTVLEVLRLEINTVVKFRNVALRSPFILPKRRHISGISILFLLFSPLWTISKKHTTSKMSMQEIRTKYSSIRKK